MNENCWKGLVVLGSFVSAPVVVFAPFIFSTPVLVVSPLFFADDNWKDSIYHRKTGWSAKSGLLKRLPDLRYFETRVPHIFSTDVSLVLAAYHLCRVL